MRQRFSLRHEFVDNIPEELADHTLYISLQFATVVHKCCCGCGSEIVTPLTPTDWSLTFDGESISLDPSIGNWSLECQSHYWIERGAVRWAERWTPERIKAGRDEDRSAKEKFYRLGIDPAEEATLPVPEGRRSETPSVWRKVRDWWRRTIR